MQLAVMFVGNTAIQSAVDSPEYPHKRPQILRLHVFFVFSLANIWNNSRVTGVEKTSPCVITYIIKIQSSHTNSKISERNYTRLQPDKLFAMTVRFIIK